MDRRKLAEILLGQQQTQPQPQQPQGMPMGGLMQIMQGQGMDGGLAGMMGNKVR